MTFFVGVAPRVIADAIATARASRAGAWDHIDRDRDRRATRAERRADRAERWAKAWADRRRARHQRAGGDGNYRPGARECGRDVYHGMWEDLLERRNARRSARPPYEYDPNRPKWHERVDGAVLDKVKRAREKWGQHRGEVPPPVPWAGPPDAAPETSPHPAPSADVPPGTWTVGDNGERVELDQPSKPVPNPTDNPEEKAMTAPTQTPAGDAATEVTNNETARQAFTNMKGAAAEAADALAVLEVAKAKLAAAANSLADGVDATRFDATATSAAHEAADAINVGTLAEWSERFDTAGTAAQSGLTALDRYLDAEDLVASEGVDAQTLEPTR